MRKKLFFSAISKFSLGAAALGLMLFLPAGTVRFPEGWLLLGLLLIPMFLAGLVMMVKNPGLLRSRLEAREPELRQKLVVKLSGAMFLGAFVSAGLSFRFDFGRLPRWAGILGAVVFLLAYGLYGEVLRENTWLSRTVRVQEGQTVVDTGLYGIVRHPMYAVTLVLFLSMPLVLRSWVSLLWMAAYPVLIGLRIRSEEEILCRELAGYEAYRKKVKYRLIPGIF